MNRIRKLAAVVKEGVSNPEKIKKGLKVLKNQGPVIFKERLSNSINYEKGKAEELQWRYFILNCYASV